MEPNSPHSGRENVNPFIANTAMGRVPGSDTHITSIPSFLLIDGMMYAPNRCVTFCLTRKWEEWCTKRSSALGVPKRGASQVARF